MAKEYRVRVKAEAGPFQIEEHETTIRAADLRQAASPGVGRPAS